MCVCMRVRARMRIRAYLFLWVGESSRTNLSVSTSHIQRNTSQLSHSFRTCLSYPISYIWHLISLLHALRYCLLFSLGPSISPSLPDQLNEISYTYVHKSVLHLTPSTSLSPYNNVWMQQSPSTHRNHKTITCIYHNNFTFLFSYLGHKDDLSSENSSQY